MVAGIQFSFHNVPVNKDMVRLNSSEGVGEYPASFFVREINKISICKGCLLDSINVINKI